MKDKEEEAYGAVLVDRHANQYTLMRPSDLSRPYHDDGLVHELLATLAAAFVFGGGATTVGLPSFIGHMGAGVLLGPLWADATRHMVQLETLGQLGIELFLFGVTNLASPASSRDPANRLTAGVSTALWCVRAPCSDHICSAHVRCSARSRRATRDLPWGGR